MSNQHLLFDRADLSNLVNEAALLAGRLNKVVVEKCDFIHAVERSIAVYLYLFICHYIINFPKLLILILTLILIRSLAPQGIEKKTAKLKGNEKAVVARHEAGHAVVGTAVAKLLHGQPQVQVNQISSDFFTWIA